MKKKQILTLIGWIIIWIILCFSILYILWKNNQTLNSKDDGIDIGNLVEKLSVEEEFKNNIKTLEDVTKLSNTINAWNWKYTFDLPKNWISRKVNLGNVKSLLLLPEERNWNTSTESMSITTEQFNWNIDSYIETTIKLTKKIFPTTEVIKNWTIKIWNNTYKLLINKQNQNWVDLEITQYLFEKDNIFYIITHIKKAKTETKYQEDINKVLESFKIK